jgi:Holliday junction resolvase RusA-like endonuclease
MDIEIPNDHILVRRLWDEGANAAPEERVRLVLQAYTESTDSILSEPPTPDQLNAVRLWMFQQTENMPKNAKGHSASLYTKQQKVSLPLVHPSAATKSGWLQQAPCITCLAVEDITPSKISFGVRTRPFSAQSLNSNDLRNLKSKIKKSLVGRLNNLESWEGMPLCVRAVAVVGKKDPVKDVDNMVKGLLDALQESAYSNDNLIAHLSVERLRHSGDDGWYALSISPVQDPLNDVVDKEARVIWPGVEEITV